MAISNGQMSTTNARLSWLNWHQKCEGRSKRTKKKKKERKAPEATVTINGLPVTIAPAENTRQSSTHNTIVAMLSRRSPYHCWLSVVICGHRLPISRGRHYTLPKICCYHCAAGSPCEWYRVTLAKWFTHNQMSLLREIYGFHDSILGCWGACGSDPHVIPPFTQGRIALRVQAAYACDPNTLSPTADM